MRKVSIKISNSDQEKSESLERILVGKRASEKLSEQILFVRISRKLR